MERNVKVIYKENPVLLDKVIQDIQRKLDAGLSWLDYAFGRAYKLVEHRDDGSKMTYPSVYVGNSEYVSLLPNDELGNFCWFDIYDPQVITLSSPSLPLLSFDGAVIFWMNLDTIFPENSALYLEEVKNEILQILTGPGVIQNGGRIELTKIYERFENIYKNYSLERVYNNYTYKGEGSQAMDKQFFMHPYAGLRFEFKIITRELCKQQ